MSNRIVQINCVYLGELLKNARYNDEFDNKVTFTVQTSDSTEDWYTVPGIDLYVKYDTLLGKNKFSVDLEKFLSVEGLRVSIPREHTRFRVLHDCEVCKETEDDIVAGEGTID